MRILLAILFALQLCAQEAAKPVEAKPEEKTDAAQTDQSAASPVPAAEPSFSGSVDFGYRWVNTGGSFNTYRSVIDLGAGPKLFGLDFTFQDPKHRLFDRLDVRATDWGGDPYNTVTVNARKRGVYDFRSSYRNMRYFDFLPSFADPTAGLGFFLDQRSYDMQRRVSSFQLDLRPGTQFIPYVAYDRNSNYGDGITTFVANSNSYPVRNGIRDSMDNYRGGLRIEMPRYHVTLEQGGTMLKDDQNVFSGPAGSNFTTPILGQTLSLTSLLQAYGVRGHSIYSKGLATANPFSWLNLYGQFLYSEPQNDINYNQANTGNFLQLSPLLFYTAQLDLFTGVAKMPHTSASAGAEIRPFKRLRIVESWMTDRLHNATLGILNERLLVQGGTTQTPLPLALGDYLMMNYNQQEADAFFDLTSKITLRGGHRIVWGDALLPPTALTPGGQTGKERRQVGIGGLSFRTGQKLSASVDFEGASAANSYFRTSLHDYQLLRARARYQMSSTLSLNANFNYLNNEDPTPGINYSFTTRDNTFSVFWTPGGGKRISVLAEYDRSTVRSNINYLAPQTLTPELSFYRDNAHSINSLIDLALPSYAGGLTPKISLGGNFILSSGSRPTQFYQPVGRLAVPLHKNVSWVSEWRYYGFGEPFYMYEAFRAHLVTTGLRITR